MTEPPLRRVRIVGTSGSGKSHLAAQLATILGVARLELDAVFWDAEWTYRDLEEAHAQVRAFAAENPDGWVVDGNWTSRLQGLLDPGTPGGADVYVWLDHPRRTVMRRVIGRTLRRGILQEELWHGNRERVRDWVRWEPERNIVRWAWTNHPVTRERMLQRIADGVPVVRLRGQREVDAWLSSLSEKRRSVEP
ncbi:MULTISPECIES: toxin [Microbacterium]|uniref:Adenylate kinase n=1 Tax=Microbacterium saccharophilum TaxID=1213358 RepID=A0A7Z7CX45_9MICO|nr:MULTISPECIES: toxin [Microbacterium]SFI16694.1 Adenylate kinase [Microbacterium saccharophilum]